MSQGLVIGATDPVVIWCMHEAIERARGDADRMGLQAVGIVVGSPSAQQWSLVQEMERVVAVLGAQPMEGAYTEILAARAEVICAIDPADSHPAVASDTPVVVTGLARPTEVAPEFHEDPRAMRIYDALLESPDPPDPTTIVVISGAGARLEARAAVAWQSGMPVVAVVEGPVPERLLRGGALVADTGLVAYEAADVLARAEPLRRSIARRGRRLLETMPDSAAVAAGLLEAMVLASEGSDRTSFVSA